MRVVVEKRDGPDSRQAKPGGGEMHLVDGGEEEEGCAYWQQLGRGRGLKRAVQDFQSQKTAD